MTVFLMADQRPSTTIVGARLMRCFSIAAGSRMLAERIARAQTRRAA